MLITDPVLLQSYASPYRVWQGIPTIERTPGGKLLAACFSGMTTECVGNYVLLMESRDNGETFSQPIAVAYNGQSSRCYDPTLWLDPLGRLWFTWNLVPEMEVWGVICQNPDADVLEWSSEFCLGRDIMINKPTVLSSGDWLFPMAVWEYTLLNRCMRDFGVHNVRIGSEFETRNLAETGANVYLSQDQGRTLRYLGGCAHIISRSHEEHMVYERRDGVLVMLIRTLYGIGKSLSYDGGRTWTISEDSGIPGPCSRFHVRRLASGRLLLVNHHRFTGRNNLTAFLSEDDGETWPYTLLLDERSNVSYPDVALGPDGALYIAYDRERGSHKRSLAESQACARELLLARINEQDILAGKLVTPGSRLKMIISKLGAYEGPQDIYDPIVKIDPAEFLKHPAELKDLNCLLEKIFAYYPYNCQCMTGADSRRVDEVIDRLWADQGDRAQLLTQLVTLLNSAQSRADNLREEPLVAQAMAAIRQDPAQPVSLPELCSRLKVSRYYLCHLFRRKTGLTLLEYRDALRTALAKEQLTRTNHSITAIAGALGYDDPGAFTRAFRKATGMSPTVYRKCHTSVT